ncbi:unnamed protein product [Clonostachys rosea f. rosea IK726]|uniref:AB hydrolase-1 domain-containing protein n=2 Tax=Bionectria ochroleuca TaxID=29856 RepID=A0A0B7KSD2_BIOOC|nr:unnamed protein product [Clonostachys rosea f. rosea IK726]
MAATTTIKVSYLGDITAGYRLSGTAVDQAKPTLVLIKSMWTTSSLYEAQFKSESLADIVNLLATEPLGDNATSCASEYFTYWDSATMALEVLDALKIKKAYALGTSQGGWIVVRMALLAPERGCAHPRLYVDEAWRESVAKLRFSGAVSAETLAFWDETVKSVYSGVEVLKKLRMATINLLFRDGLLARLGDVKCPVYWLQGTEDPVYGKIAPTEHIELFTSSPEATVTFVEGAGHCLNATSPEDAEEAILEMIKKHPWQHKL